MTAIEEKSFQETLELTREVERHLLLGNGFSMRAMSPSPLLRY